MGKRAEQIANSLCFSTDSAADAIFYFNFFEKEDENTTHKQTHK